MSDTKRLIWRRQLSERGLAPVCPYQLFYGGESIGSVGHVRSGFTTHSKEGYFWAARGDNVPWRNTAGAPLPTVEEAKEQCEDYVRFCLGLKARKGVRA